MNGTLLYMIGIGGMEVLVLCAIIGGVTGYFIRNKSSKNGALVSVILGVVGAVIITFLLSQLLYGGLLVMPLYSVLGGWLFNFIWLKISGK